MVCYNKQQTQTLERQPAVAIISSKGTLADFAAEVAALLVE